jgi:tetraacyldisaccharide 4'-kinase
MAQTVNEQITQAWYSKAKWLYALWPLSLLYRLIVVLRKRAFDAGLLKIYRSTKPLIVVGNITVGGTGKSPLVCYLAQALSEHGLHPGVVSRGYGATIGKRQVREVFRHSLASEVGDEPLMLKRRLDCPLFVSPSRVLAVKALEKAGCDVIISDDGLQHYAMARDIEICVFDGKRFWGNGHLLPMGPLREPLQRLRNLPFIVINGGEDQQLPVLAETVSSQSCFNMSLLAEQLVSLNDHTTAMPLDVLTGKTVHAVAAIGNPERFFTTLEMAGLCIIRHVFPDHHAYRSEDFAFLKDVSSEQLLIMTEKDAVKCQALRLKNAWYLPVNARLTENLAEKILERLETKIVNKRG